MNGPDAAATTLSPGQRATVQALAATIVADDPEIMGGVDREAVALRMAEHLAAYPWTVVFIVKFVLLLLEYGFPPVAMKFGRFSRCSPETRLRVVTQWEKSPLGAQRNLFKLLKIMTLTSLLHDPHLIALMDYNETLEHRMTRPEPGSPGDTPCKRPGT